MGLRVYYSATLQDASWTEQTDAMNIDLNLMTEAKSSATFEVSKRDEATWVGRQYKYIQIYETTTLKFEGFIKTIIPEDAKVVISCGDIAEMLEFNSLNPDQSDFVVFEGEVSTVDDEALHITTPEGDSPSWTNDELIGYYAIISDNNTGLADVDFVNSTVGEPAPAHAGFSGSTGIRQIGGGELYETSDWIDAGVYSDVKTGDASASYLWRAKNTLLSYTKKLGLRMKLNAAHYLIDDDLALSKITYSTSFMYDNYVGFLITDSSTIVTLAWRKTTSSPAIILWQSPLILTGDHGPNGDGVHEYVVQGEIPISRINTTYFTNGTDYWEDGYMELTFEATSFPNWISNEAYIEWYNLNINVEYVNTTYDETNDEIYDNTSNIINCQDETSSGIDFDLRGVQIGDKVTIVKDILDAFDVVGNGQYGTKFPYPKLYDFDPHLGYGKRYMGFSSYQLWVDLCEYLDKLWYVDYRQSKALVAIGRDELESETTAITGFKSYSVSIENQDYGWILITWKDDVYSYATGSSSPYIYSEKRKDILTQQEAHNYAVNLATKFSSTAYAIQLNYDSYKDVQVGYEVGTISIPNGLGLSNTEYTDQMIRRVHYTQDSANGKCTTTIYCGRGFTPIDEKIGREIGLIKRRLAKDDAIEMSQTYNPSLAVRHSDLLGVLPSSSTQSHLSATRASEVANGTLKVLNIDRLTTLSPEPRAYAGWDCLASNGATRNKITNLGDATTDYDAMNKISTEQAVTAGISAELEVGGDINLSIIDIIDDYFTFYTPLTLDAETGDVKLYNNASTPAAITNIDIDGTLGTNSDTILPTQKAVKTYAVAKATTNTVTDTFAIVPTTANTNTLGASGKEFKEIFAAIINQPNAAISQYLVLKSISGVQWINSVSDSFGLIHDGGNVQLSADGAAANINLSLAPKGTGYINVNYARIYNLADGSDACDAVNKGQLDTKLNSDGLAAQNLLLKDNEANALDIKEGSTSYINIATTNGSELITVSKNATFAGTLTQTANQAITDNAIITADAVDIADDEYARFTANGLESRSKSEVAADLKDQFPQAITDNHVVTIDSSSVADNDYAKFTANGVEGRNADELFTDLEIIPYHYKALYSFESDTVGGVPTGWTQTAGVTAVIQAQLHNHHHILYHTSTPSLGSYWGINSFTEQTSGTVELWYYLESTIQSSIRFQQGGTWAFSVTTINGNICGDVAISLYEWHHIRIIFDCATDTYDVWLDEVEIKNGVAFNNARTGIDSLRLEAAGAGVFAVDAIDYSWDANYVLNQNIAPHIITDYYTSVVATGTAPLTVASTTKVSNLNVDQVDGIHVDLAAGDDGYLVKYTHTGTKLENATNTDSDVASAVSLKHAAATVAGSQTALTISTQELALKNNAVSPATITTIEQDTISNSAVKIPASNLVYAVKSTADNSVQKSGGNTITDTFGLTPTTTNTNDLGATGKDFKDIWVRNLKSGASMGINDGIAQDVYSRGHAVYFGSEANEIKAIIIRRNAAEVGRIDTTNLYMTYKATSAHDFTCDNSGQKTVLRLADSVADADSYVQITNGKAGTSDVIIEAAGTAANNLQLKAGTAKALLFYAGSSYLGAANASNFLFYVPYVGYSSTDVAATAAYIGFQRARSSSPYTIQSGDLLGTFRWQGYDSNSFETCSEIRSYATAAWGNNDLPSDLRFYTTPDGAATPLEVLRLNTSATSAVNYLAVTNAAASNPIILAAESASESNIDIKISPKGTGSVDVNSKKITNLADAVADTDAVPLAQAIDEAEGVVASHENSYHALGVDGQFETVDGYLITVVDGMITSIDVIP